MVTAKRTPRREQICDERHTRDDVKANRIYCSGQPRSYSRASYRPRSIQTRYRPFFFLFLGGTRVEIDQSITQASLVPGPPGPDVPPAAPAEEPDPDPDPIPSLDFDIDPPDPSCPAPPAIEVPDDVALIEGWLRRIDPILSFFISRRWYTFRSSRYCRINPS